MAPVLNNETGGLPVWENVVVDPAATVEVVLLATGWVGNTYVVACTVRSAVTAGLPVPTPDENYNIAAVAGLRISAVAVDSITISATTVPTADVTIAITGVTI